MQNPREKNVENKMVDSDFRYRLDQDSLGRFAQVFCLFIF
jgi:hypothetical protein